MTKLKENVDKLNSLLKEGWEPFGSVFVVAECVHQPMITYKSK